MDFMKEYAPLREIGARTGDTVQVMGGPTWKLIKVDETGFYIDDELSPKLSEVLPFRIVEKAANKIIRKDLHPHRLYDEMRGATKVTITDPSSHEDKKQLWLHVKSGNHYKILYHGLFEGSLKPAVIYQAYDGTGPIWVRPADQFFDGRFRNWE